MRCVFRVRKRKQINHRGFVTQAATHSPLTPFTFLVDRPGARGIQRRAAGARRASNERLTARRNRSRVWSREPRGAGERESEETRVDS